MIQRRRATERGATKIDWLDSRHTFSFAEYYDSAHMGFGALRVINDDRVAPARGFGRHGHRDMEIVSYVVEGELEHQDSMGNGSVMRRGDVQRMTAGTGVLHSEKNPSKDRPVRFLQIWIVPSQPNLLPDYEQKSFRREMDGRLCLVGSSDGRDGSLTIHQDVSMYAGNLAAGTHASLSIGHGRGAWVQIVRGRVRVNGEELAEGDGAALVDEHAAFVHAIDAAEVIVFDLSATG